MAIKSYSTTPASNNSASPNGFPEGMAPSGYNDSARQVMADIRSWYDDVEFRDWGHTVTRTGNTTFTIPTDVTAIYVANRPIRCADSSTLYGYVASSSYSAPDTTVTVTLDSGNLSASLTAVALGITPSTQSIPVQAIRNQGSALLSATNTWAGKNTYTGNVIWAKGADVASANALTLGTDGNYFDVTGTAAITSISTMGVGAVVKLHFDGALTLTHHATDLILPGGANITTAAGDEAEFVEYASGDWRCTNYTKADGGNIATTAANVQTFTSSGTWTKPTGYNASTLVRIQAWGGGGGGANGGGIGNAGGGGGGGYTERRVLLSDMSATETVTIGAGGIGKTAVSGNGTAGGSTTVGSLLTAYGGGGGTTNGGGGGGSLGAGGDLSGGAIDGAAGGAAGGGAPTYPNTLWGGGGGGGGTTSGNVAGGKAVYGGGGGGADGTTAAAGGTSLYGGNGGGTGGAAAQPGGGGVGRHAGNGSDGAAGKVIITVGG